MRYSFLFAMTCCLISSSSPTHSENYSTGFDVRSFQQNLAFITLFCILVVVCGLCVVMENNNALPLERELFWIKLLWTRWSHWILKCAFSVPFCFQISKWRISLRFCTHTEYYISFIEHRFGVSFGYLFSSLHCFLWWILLYVTHFSSLVICLSNV